MANVAELEARLNALDSRLAVAEAQTANTAERLERQESKNDGFADRLARLEERVTHLPTKDFVVKVAIATISAIVLLLGLQVAFWKAAVPPILDQTPQGGIKPRT